MCIRHSQPIHLSKRNAFLSKTHYSIRLGWDCRVLSIGNLSGFAKYVFNARMELYLNVNEVKMCLIIISD